MQSKQLYIGMKIFLESGSKEERERERERERENYETEKCAS